jgi:hypothetical protein
LDHKKASLRLRYANQNSENVASRLRSTWAGMGRKSVVVIFSAVASDRFGAIHGEFK